MWMAILESEINGKLSEKREKQPINAKTEIQVKWGLVFYI